jgi:hypothetical protein
LRPIGNTTQRETEDDQLLILSEDGGDPLLNGLYSPISKMSSSKDKIKEQANNLFQSRRLNIHNQPMTAIPG